MYQLYDVCEKYVRYIISITLLLITINHFSIIIHYYHDFLILRMKIYEKVVYEFYSNVIALHKSQIALRSSNSIQSDL